MVQMGRQKEQTFHQRNQQTGDNHCRKDGNKLAHNPTDKSQGDKGNDGGNNRSKDRHTNLCHTFYCSLKRWLSPKTVHVDRFADHNGVVHHDTKHHDKPEQGNHVDGLAHGKQNKQSTGQRNGDTEPGPEAEPQIEKKPEQEKNQPQTN